MTVHLLHLSPSQVSTGGGSHYAPGPSTVEAMSALSKPMAKLSRKARRLAKRGGMTKPPAASSPGGASLKGKGLRMAISHADGTRTEIRHMAAYRDETDTFYALSAIDAPSGDDGKPVWIQLAKDGRYNGHAKGPFTLNSGVYATLIQNFRKNSDGRIRIDFEHASEMPPTSGDTAVVGAPAQGWILDLRQEPGRLMALVEWGDTARQYIREGKYRFISPAIRFKQRNPVSGEEQGPTLSSAGLTNGPFIQGMAPLAASSLAAESNEAPTTLGLDAMCYSANEFMPRIKMALRLPELCSAQECSDHLERLRGHLDAVNGDHCAVHEGICLADYLLPLRSIAQPQMGATWDDVLDVIDALLVAAGADGDDADDVEASAELAQPTETTPETPAPSAPATVETTEETSMTTPATPAAAPAAVTAAPAPVPAPAPAAPVLATAAHATDVTTLRLSLQASDAEVTRLRTEVTTLSQWKADREESDLATEASIAFDTYKDKKGLTEADRPVLLSLLRSNQDAFRALYPPVAPSERHLLRTLAATPRAIGGAVTTMSAPRAQADIPNASEPVVMSLRDLSRKIQRTERIPLGQAQIKAKRIIDSQRAQQQGAR